MTDSAVDVSRCLLRRSRFSSCLRRRSRSNVSIPSVTEGIDIQYTATAFMHYIHQRIIIIKLLMLQCVPPFSQTLRHSPEDL